MKRIDDPLEYRDYLETILAEGIPLPDNDELLNVSLEFTGREALGFCDQTYLDCLWRVMSSYAPPGVAPSANDLVTLNWFAKDQKKGWFTGEVASSYGAAIFSQMPRIETLMKANPMTRQAVIVGPPGACLISIQFLLRRVIEDGVDVPRFFTIANFRSSDAIYGLPADFWFLRKLTEMLTDETTSVEMPIIINAGSLHIYDRNKDLIL